MIEELKDEKLIKKVGGRFRLTTLIQKRLASKKHGDAPDGEKAAQGEKYDEKDYLMDVVHEILDDKVSLELDEDGEPREANVFEMSQNS